MRKGGRRPQAGLIGCRCRKWMPACVNCHEQAVRHEGGTQEIIFEVIRLGPVVKGLCVALREGAPLPQT